MFNKLTKTEKQIVGRVGEDLACKFLVDKGFKVIERNYWKPWGEVDIIAKKGSQLYFIEVKTVSRESNDFSGLDSYQPEDNIHPWKLKRLSRTIETYLLDKDIREDVDWQMDAICVYLDREMKQLKIEYIEEIF